jgi:hypothetical protein
MNEQQRRMPEISVNPLYQPGHPEFGVSVMYDPIVLVRMAQRLFADSLVATYAEMFAERPSETDLHEPTRQQLN